MASNARLIALYSPRPQQGKSEVAKTLMDDYGFARVKFAAPLKHMTATFLRACGVANDQIERYVEGDLKEAQIPGLPKGTTSRHVQRTLGTEWGRKNIADTLWIDLALAKARKFLNDGRSVIIDDMRFPNEYVAVVKAGGEVWRIARKANTRYKSDGHSEALLEGEYFDVRLLNAFTLDDLKRGVSAIAELGSPLGLLRRAAP